MRKLQERHERERRHGTVAGYINNDYCPCAPCQTAWNEYAHQSGHKYALGALSLHGKYSTYVYRACRCDLCRAAWREYSRDYARRKRQAKGAPVGAHVR